MREYTNDWESNKKIQAPVGSIWPCHHEPTTSTWITAKLMKKRWHTRNGRVHDDGALAHRGCAREGACLCHESGNAVHRGLPSPSTRSLQNSVRSVNKRKFAPKKKLKIPYGPIQCQQAIDKIKVLRNLREFSNKALRIETSSLTVGLKLLRCCCRALTMKLWLKDLSSARSRESNLQGKQRNVLSAPRAYKWTI